MTPPVAKLYHEVAHWSYINVLTPDDRITFLNHIKGRMDGGETPQEIVGDLYISNTGATGNYDLSPQEFFANSFEQWVMGNKSPEIETLMQRVSEIIRAAIDFFITKSPIVDPELDMLFRKILPDEFQGEIDLPSEDIVKQAANPGAQLAAGKLFQLDDARRSIHEAIESQDPMRMREVANDAAREALGLSRLKMLTKRTFKAADGSIRRSKQVDAFVLSLCAALKPLKTKSPSRTQASSKTPTTTTTTSSTHSRKATTFSTVPTRSANSKTAASASPTFRQSLPVVL